MDHKKIEQSIVDLQDQLNQKESYAKDTTDKITELRAEWQRTKEEYDQLFGEITGLKKVLSDSL